MRVTAAAARLCLKLNLRCLGYRIFELYFVLFMLLPALGGMSLLILGYFEDSRLYIMFSTMFVISICNLKLIRTLRAGIRIRPMKIAAWINLGAVLMQLSAISSVPTLFMLLHPLPLAAFWLYLGYDFLAAKSRKHDQHI